LVQLEVYVGVIVVIALAAILYYYFVLAKRREPEVTAEISIQESQAMKEERSEIRDLTKVRGIGPKWSKKLKDAGVNSVKDLAECDSKDLARKIGVSEKIASRWIKGAKELLSEE